jgi:hypothetical protein
MAKEEKDGKKEAEPKKRRLHLHELRSTQAEDGSIVHHATYKEHKGDMHTMPERGPMATSANPEEAGQHVADQFGMNQMGAEPEPQSEGEPEPQPGA